MLLFILSFFSCLTTTTTVQADVTIDYAQVEINGEFPYLRD